VINKLYNNPSKIFLLSSIFIFILLLLPFYKVNNEFNLISYFFIFTCFLAAYLGLRIGFSHNKLNYIKTNINSSKLIIVYKICIIISIIGIILTFYEFFVVRKISLELNFIYNKNKWLEGSPSFSSFIAAGFKSFSVFLIPFYFYIKEKNYNKNYSKNYLFISIIISIFHIFFEVLLGSRAPILFSIMYVLISYLYFKKKISIFFIFISVVIFIYMSGLFFDYRLRAFDSNLFNSLYYSAYSFQVSPTENYSDNQNFDNFFFTSLYSIYFYFIHGFYEILYMIENSVIYYDFGKNLFWLPVKILNIFFNFNLNSSDIFRQGVYKTFIYTFFRDFKYFSPIVIFIIFFLFSYPFKYLAQGNTNWYFVTSVIFLYLLACPFFSPFSSGSISYLLLDSLVMRMFLFIITEKKH